MGNLVFNYWLGHVCPQLSVALVAQALVQEIQTVREPRAHEPVQATAAAPFAFEGLGDSLLLGLVLAQSPAAVPDFSR